MPYVFCHGHIAIKNFNSKGFGAGGVAPLTFSHLNRNWATTLPSFTIKAPLGEELVLEGTQYGPGVSLPTRPGAREEDMRECSYSAVSVEEEVSGGEEFVREEGEEEERLPSSSSEEEDAEVGRKKKRQKVMVPSGEVKCHQGGRGRSRHRDKRKTLDAAGESSTCPPCNSRHHMILYIY